MTSALLVAAVITALATVAGAVAVWVAGADPAWTVAGAVMTVSLVGLASRRRDTPSAHR